MHELYLKWIVVVLASLQKDCEKKIYYYHSNRGLKSSAFCMQKNYNEPSLVVSYDDESDKDSPCYSSKNSVSFDLGGDKKPTYALHRYDIYFVD